MFVGMDYKYWRKHLDSELQKFPEAKSEKYIYNFSKLCKR